MIGDHSEVVAVPVTHQVQLVRRSLRASRLYCSTLGECWTLRGGGSDTEHHNTDASLSTLSDITFLQ